jgi:hypothetical protein
LDKYREKFIKVAKHSGNWLLQNQITDYLDANCGRFLYCCNINNGDFQRSTGGQYSKVGLPGKDLMDFAKGDWMIKLITK